jgi:FMN reductase
MARPLILGIGGTLRPGSTSEKALRFALRAAQRHGANITALTGEDLCVPMYGHADGARSEAAARLVRLMRDCDGIIVSSPSFHGSISGLVKNAIDYTEEMKTDERVYFDGLAFGCIACAAGWQAVGTTLTAMRSIAHALRAWPNPMGAGINSLANPFDESGNCVDQNTAFQLELVGRQVVDFARMRSMAEAQPAPREEHLQLAVSR